MNKTVSTARISVAFGVPLLLLSALAFLMASSLIALNDTMVLAITIDLLLTVPVIYYLLIRTTSIPKTTILPVLIAGLLIGSYMLPKEHQTWLALFKTWVLPWVELPILTFVIIKVRNAVKTYQNSDRDNLHTSFDFFDTLKNICSEILPKKLVTPFATEVAVFYYGFIHWKKRVFKDNEFSYHKESGTPSLFGGIILVIIIESVALHFLLAQWFPTGAWILTGISLYTTIQVFGFAKALSQRPVSVGQKHLTVRYGILNEAQIPYQDIESVNLSGKPFEKDPLTRHLSPLGEMESHNVIIRLKREHVLTGLYGIHKKFKVLVLHIDKPDEFKETVKQNLAKSHA